MDSHRPAGIGYNGAAAVPDCPVTSFLKRFCIRCKDDKKDGSFTITHHAAGIRADLDTLGFAASPELSYTHLAAAERSLPDVAFRYVVLYEQGRPVFVASFQLFTLTDKNFDLEKNKTFIKGIFRMFLELKKAKVLVLGNALRTEAQGYCYDPTVFNKADAIEALVAAAQQIADTEDATATILPGMESIGMRNTRTLTRAGYAMPWEDNVMELPIDPAWSTLGDYIAALSRKYRTRAGKVLADREGLTVRHLCEEDMARYQPAINSLFADVIGKQSFTFTRSGAAYIAALKELYGDAFEVVAFFKEEKPVAFYSAFVTADAYELFYVGFDTAHNGEHQLYFNLLFSGLERAIQLNKAQLKLGRTSFDAKASLGAKPRRMDYFIRLRHIPDVAVKWFSSYFSSMEDTKWKQRDPLKNSKNN